MEERLDYDRLYQLANEQFGFFASAQAKRLGYSQQMQSYYVQTGQWLRKARGIFRLKNYPAPYLQDDLYVTYLWTCNRDGKPEGVYSHDTALAMYEISTYVPPLLDITVPKHFRRHSDPPYRTKLWKCNIQEVHCNRVRGLMVTNPLRTMIDLLQARVIDGDYIEESLRNALDKYLITPAQLKKANLAAEERTILLSVLEKIKYEWIDEIR